jgi:hypothetical protein
MIEKQERVKNLAEITSCLPLEKGCEDSIKKGVLKVDIQFNPKSDNDI